MRIVIDMQGAQSTGSRDRGIGRYTMSLVKAIVLQRGEHEILLALNGLFPETIEPIRAIFDSLLPQNNIRVWQSPGPLTYHDPENNWRRKTAELVREAFFASLKPDIVLVTSLFEGLDADAVTSIGTLSRTVPTAVILYDLIPLIHRKPYLDSPVVAAWYANKLDHVRRADLLLAISESSRQEGIHYLGFPADVCVNISTAADPHFQPQNVGHEREQNVRQRYGLDHQFVLYTGGIDHRKNIEGLIRAYAKLPKSVRTKHQLAIVCSVQPPSRTALEALAKEQGLKSEELVLTGFVPEDDLLSLYSLCKVFIFPSWHEGFGLPALEAMSCGCAVIGSNISSIPEVIGREDALFDPKSDESITDKLAKVLTDDAFRSELKKHGLEQAKRFSWDASAQRAITSFKALHAKKDKHLLTYAEPARRPKLAYVSPLPPVRSGISDYSAELLPELSRYYDIDMVVAQNSVSDPNLNANFPMRTVDWFMAHAEHYDRILYHFGNSPFHQHMFRMLNDVPGVVVLHDFYLSQIISNMDWERYMPGAHTEALYQSHGYMAVQQKYQTVTPEKVTWRYPCNLSVIRRSNGVIVHSENSRRLADQWYGEGAADDWAVVPLLRVPAVKIDRAEARHKLNLSNDVFLVCSFGMLGPAKLSHRLLDAWLASALKQNPSSMLVFVGENPGGEYGAKLVTAINRSGLSQRIRITGWADTEIFRQYLAAADLGVQLRTLSRGETSAAVLDCMNYGLPIIVNANGSMADLPENVVWKLPDEFGISELVDALETLWRIPSRRQQLGATAREVILEHHSPRVCADQYARAIETMYRRSLTGVSALTQALAGVETAQIEPEDLVFLVDAITLSIRPKLAPHQLLVDISILVQYDAKSGIQRVVRSILKEMLTNPPEGYRVEPVYATPDKGHRYARHFTLRYINCTESVLADEPIEYQAGDVFLCLDLAHSVVISRRADLEQMRRHGVQIWFAVYDLLPITMPNAFPDKVAELHHAWLKVLADIGNAVCISEAVADELTEWLKSNGTARQRPVKIGWFHLGADINASSPSQGVPRDAKSVLNAIGAHPSFLMVGTIEPRKGHAQTLSAFEILWAAGVEANMVIVGNQGWKMESLVDRLRNHPETGKRLFWLESISDEYLENVYANSSCLIAASEGEGFGLPLIEAAQHKLPIIARDIQVFREVAGEHAYYFSGSMPEAIADAVRDWMSLNAEDKAPKSDKMPWLTWAESYRQLMDVVLDIDVRRSLACRTR